MVREGDLAPGDLVQVLLACAAVEQQSTVLRTILQTTKQIPSSLITSATSFTVPARRAERVRLVADALRELAQDAEPGSDRQYQLVTAFARLGHGEQDVARLRGALDGSEPYPGLEMDQDLRWVFLSALAAAGAADEDEIEAEASRDRTAVGRERAFHARAARPTAAAKAEAWRLAVEEDGQPNSVIEALGTGFNRALDAPALLGDYVARWHDMLLPVWHSRSAAIRERIITFFYPLGLVGPELEAATSAWLEAHPDAPAALRRLVSEELDAVRTAVRAQEADAKRG